MNKFKLSFKIVIALIAIFQTTRTEAQIFNVKGIILDENRVPLDAAMVVVLEAKDSTMIGFCMTNQKGEYKIPNVPSTIINLQITYIGYGTIQKTIDVNGEVKTIDLGPIQMSQTSSLLENVNITADFVPIRVTKDTVEFNAEAFKVQPNATVEDLLKKLPGVEVDNAGTITVRGEEVKAVTVDGKDFFGKDPKMATRNLPADAVKKVQVFDKKSKNSQFTGVDDGQDEKTINLELKADRKSGIFGNALAGIGTDQRYETKGILNRFSKKNQWSMIGSANNLNQQGINPSDLSSMAGAANMMNTNAPINFGGPSAQGDIKSGILGANYNHEFTKFSKVNMSYYLTQSKNQLNENVDTRTFVQDSSLLSQKVSNQIIKNTNHNFAATSDIRIDSLTEITINGSVTARNTNSNNTLVDSTFNQGDRLINRNQQATVNEQKNTTWSVNLSVRRKFARKGRNMTLNAQYGVNTGDVLSDILSSLFDQNAVLNLANSVYQSQDIINNSKNYTLGASYNEPISRKWTSSTSISFRNNRADQIKDFFNLDPMNTTFKEFNEQLSRTFDNTFRYSFLGQSFIYRVENLTYKMGVEYQNSQLVGIPSVGEKISRPFNYFLPNASIEWEKPSLRFNYNTNVREPSVDQLQPILDNSNPLNTYEGNPSLTPEYRHNFRLGYNYFDQFNFRGFFANIRYTYTDNKITTATQIKEFGRRVRRPINTDYESSLSTFANYNSPINSLNAKFRVGGNASWTQGINLINDIENTIDRVSQGFSLTLENKQKKTIDISATTRWSFNQNLYQNNSSQNTSFVNQSYEGNAAIYPGKGWTIETSLIRSVYGQGSFDQATTISLWNASVSKQIFKNKWQLKLRVFDILNQNQGVARSASEFAITESVSNTIGRYFMVSIFYDIKSFATNNTNKEMFFRH